MERSVDSDILDAGLRGQFTLKNFKRSKFIVASLLLDKEGLEITEIQPRMNGKTESTKKKSILIKPEDIVAVFQLEKNEITVCCYPYEKKQNKKDSAATRVHRSFAIVFDNVLSSDLELWTKALDNLMHKEKNPPDAYSSLDLPVLVLINPSSGPGRAHKMFNKQVAPVMSEAGMQFTVQVTTHANHAHEIMQTMDLTKFKAIVSIGGDGLLYEIFNGLGSRKDASKALQMPIGIVPGGSGNGLAKSLAHWRKESKAQTSTASGSALVAALNIVQGTPQPMDLVQIHTSKGTLLSFLSLGIGMISDIDIESESLRSLGEMRFTVWALAKITNLQKYKATIHFKRATAKVSEGLSQSMTGLSDPCPDTSPLRHSSYDLKSDPSVDTFERSPSNKELLSEGELEGGDSFRKVKTGTRKGSYPYVREGKHEEENLLNEAIDSSWETISGEYLVVNAFYQSHISSSCYICPNATPDDGLMWLFLVPGNMTRTSMVKFLVEMDSGRHLSVPGLQIIPVSELRLVPEGKKGHLVLDGELVPYGPIHAKVLPSKARVLVR